MQIFLNALAHVSRNHHIGFDIISTSCSINFPKLSRPSIFSDASGAKIIFEFIQTKLIQYLSCCFFFGIGSLDTKESPLYIFTSPCFKLVLHFAVPGV